MNASAYISPSVLQWARLRANLSVDALAEKTKVNRDEIAAWEQGSHFPTLRQAQHVAGALHVPFGVLFLPNPPKEELPLRDFRTLSASAPSRPSAELVDTINEVVVKQDWYREYISSEGGTRPEVVGKRKATDEPNRVAAEISRDLRLPEIRSKVTSWGEFLGAFIRAVESLGVLVMKSSIVAANAHRKLSVDEFRGFTISDALAPTIFINGSDARAAQIFTLAHELAHVYTNESGISNERLDSQASDISEVELRCNRIAAQLLVPESEFDWNAKIDIEVNLNALARRFRVSKLVILRRALDLNLLNKDQFIATYKNLFLNEMVIEQQQQGGSFFPALYSRNSRTFTKTLMEALALGKVGYGDAAQMLHVKVSTLNKIMKDLEEQV
jgi:Zn-dependent peptidase ImmA (M78 family)/DNA-binding XRE family transcriptional regulator